MVNRTQGWPSTIGLIIAGSVILILAFQPLLFQKLGLFTLQQIILFISDIHNRRISIVDFPLLSEMIISPCVAGIGIVMIICGCLIGLLKLIK